MLSRVGEVGGSFKFAAARIERQRPATSFDTSPVIQAPDEQPASVEPAAG